MTDDQRFGLARHVHAARAAARSTAAACCRRSRSPTRPMARSTPTRQRDPDLPRADRRPACRQRRIRVTGKPGWWTRMVGPGKPIDPGAPFRHLRQRAGQLHGLVRPGERSIPRPASPMRMAFPVITIRDMVRAQAMLLDHLGVARLHAVVGGSMGGMQALSWAATYPDRVARGGGDRLDRAPHRAEHRLPRGRAPGDHGRSRTGAAATITAASRPPPGSRWRGWRRTSPICPKPG